MDLTKLLKDKEGYYLYNVNLNSECLLFPSKEKRNWNNFDKQRIEIIQTIDLRLNFDEEKSLF